MSGDETFTGFDNTCAYCGCIHMGTCPRIRSIEYHPNGTIKRVEFHEVSASPFVAGNPRESR